MRMSEFLREIREKHGVRARASQARYAEEAGIIDEPPRDELGHRVFGPDHVNQIVEWLTSRCRKIA